MWNNINICHPSPPPPPSFITYHVLDLLFYCLYRVAPAGQQGVLLSTCATFPICPLKKHDLLPNL